MAKIFPPATDAEIDALPQELVAALRADLAALELFRIGWPNQRKAHAAWVRLSKTEDGRSKRAQDVVTTLHARAVARRREQHIIAARKSAL